VIRAAGGISCAHRTVPGSPAPTSDGGWPIAITRDSKVLYTTTFDGLLAFQINADGSVTNAPVPSYSMTDAQVGLVAHPTADFLYASGNSGVLTVLAIDSATAALSPTSPVTLSNEFLESSAVITPNGQCLYQNDLDRNDDLFPTSVQIAGFSADAATGALSPVPGSPLTLTTPSPSTTRAGRLFDRCGVRRTNRCARITVCYRWGAELRRHRCLWTAGTALQTANSPATVFMLSLDQATGALASIGETTIPDKLGVSFLALTH